MVHPMEQTSEEKEKLLMQDNKRAKLERKLARNTQKILRRRALGPRCFATYQKLFEKKTVLPESAEERENDDKARRRAVEVMMRAREICGYEKLGETERWSSSSGIDIIAELGKKFAPESVARQRAALIAERKSPRQLLQRYLARVDKGGIPRDNVDWVEKKIHDVFREPISEREMQELYLKRTHDLYYILACAREAGDNSLVELSSTGWEPEDFKRALPVHGYLHALSKKDFEEYDFGLIHKHGYTAPPLVVGFEDFITTTQIGEGARGGVKRRRDEGDHDESEAEDYNASETEDDTESEPEDDTESKSERAKWTAAEDQQHEE